MRVVLAVTLLCLATPFAQGRNQDGTKKKGHAPEMTSTAMTLAGVTSLGGYLLVRRRAARSK